MAVLVVTWAPSSNAISYQFRYALDLPNPLYIYVPTPNTSITVPGLINNQTYIVGVRSVCDGGLVSGWSDRLVVTCDGISPCDLEGTAVALNEPNIVTYGQLYNWMAASNLLLPPLGWHTPTSLEWFNLGKAYTNEYPPGSNYPSVYMVTHKFKTTGTLEGGTGLWARPDTNPNCTPGVGSCPIGVNSSGLNVEPAGIITNTGTQGGRNTDANFWCFDQTNATIGKYFNMNHNSQTLYTQSATYDKHHGFSIRLVKDNTVGYTPGSTGTMIDIDGNSYTTKMMADGKVWMTQSLRVSRYRDSSVIPVDPSDWPTIIIGAIHSYV
jgi:uncharacterized protein (TIGR02145 family)